MSDPRTDLRQAADRYWQTLLEFLPTAATLHGDHRYDDRIEDVSADAEARQRATWLELRAAVDGIDPDLTWDDDGTAYVTFAGFPHPIRQVRVDLATGEALEEVRPLWEGSGRFAPEGPHLYRRGDDWYLLIAEGGTDRGHAVSIARGPSPEGPWETNPGNPVITAAGTENDVQNPFVTTIVEMAVGGTAMVLLGSVGGEWRRLDLAASTPASWIAYLYLILIGSVIAYSAYVWLLANAPVSLVTTYAYVNPAVAVFLGWALAGEHVGGRELAAGLVILSSVGMLVAAREPREPAPATPDSLPGYIRAQEARVETIRPVPRLAELHRIAA